MKKLLSMSIALVLVLLLLPSSAFAYKYDPSRKATNPYANISHNNHILDNINFYKKSTRKPRYTSSAQPYRNPYPHKVTKADLQRLEASLESRYNNLKAPTGNYARRAFMPNK